MLLHATNWETTLRILGQIYGLNILYDCIFQNYELSNARSVLKYIKYAILRNSMMLIPVN